MASRDDLLRQYGRVLEVPHPGMTRPESQLPASRSVLKRAILDEAREHALSCEFDRNYWEALRSCYANLALFVPDAEAAPENDFGRLILDKAAGRVSSREFLDKVMAGPSTSGEVTERAARDFSAFIDEFDEATRDLLK